jgi:hypothetical protein
MGVITSTVDQGAAAAALASNCPHPNASDDGRLRNRAGAGAMAGCSVPSSRFIVDVKQPDGSRLTNYTGTLADTFSCLAQVAAGGCGFESQLEAMKRALDGSRPENAGFVRQGAFLAIVILTDEDDCSIKDGADGAGLFTLPAAQLPPGGGGDFRCQPEFAFTCDTPISVTAPGTYTNCKVRTDSFLKDPNSYAGFLGTIKDPNQIVVALIAGDPQYQGPPVLAPGTVLTGPLTQGGQTQQFALLPSCMATINGNVALGRPSIRLSQFLANFGDHGLFQTVCQSDYSTALANIGALLFKAVSPCLEGKINLADADPNNPGIQLDCTVDDVQGLDTAMQTSTRVDACKMIAEGMPDPSSPKPCWWTAVDGATCGTTDTMRKITFERGGSTPPIGTVTQVACATAPPPMP